MKTMLLLIALVALLAGCGPKNPIAPPTENGANVLDSKAGPSQVPYYEPISGEPYRGTDPDLGPTG